MKIFSKILVCLAITILAGCGSKQNDQQQEQRIITVEAKPNITTLYFNSVVKPIRSYLIISTVDGTIKEMTFKYGTRVDKGQLLFSITSPQLAADYQTTLAEYLKMKREYSNTTMQMEGTEELYKQKIISKQEYLSSKKQSYDTALSYAQATRKLQLILEKFGLKSAPLQDLETTDIDKINQVLARAGNTINMFSPVRGVAFLPDKGGSGGDSGGAPALGAQVKTGQVLASIADKSGLSFDIKVNEINIGDVIAGQKATISGDAFPHTTLYGTVEYNERQPIGNDSGGTPSYMAHIIVPHITEQQNYDIRTGMSVRVELKIIRPPTIKLPLTAVFTKQQQRMVKILDPKTNKPIDVPVRTGTTAQDTVEIQGGLKPGDKVISNAGGN
jgi:HlyD family secretion protein